MYDEDILFKTHSKLLKNTFEYNNKNPDFKKKIYSYLLGYKEYNEYLSDSINIFYYGDNRMNPIVLDPYLFNSNNSKSIIFICKRSKDLKDKPIEYVYFILAKKNDKTWQFRTKTTYQKSFSYENNAPLLSDTEISMRILIQFINWGYINKDGSINDLFFNDKKWAF